MNFAEMIIDDIEKWEVENNGLVVFCGCSGVGFSICHLAEKNKPLLIHNENFQDTMVVGYEEALRLKDFLCKNF